MSIKCIFLKEKPSLVSNCGQFCNFGKIFSLMILRLRNIIFLFRISMFFFNEIVIKFKNILSIGCEELIHIHKYKYTCHPQLGFISPTKNTLAQRLVFGLLAAFLKPH